MSIMDGDIIAVKLCQKLLGQDVCMIWTITTENPSGVIDIRELAEKVRDHIGPFINAVQSNAVENRSVLLENLTQTLYFAEVPWLGTGDYAGPVSPSFLAMGIKLTRGTKITRSGHKRVPGLIEDWVSQNGLVDSEHLQNLDDLGSAFASSVTLSMDSSESVTIKPVIVGRNADGWDLGRVNTISGYVVDTNVTSQVSRKAGQGS